MGGVWELGRDTRAKQLSVRMNVSSILSSRARVHVEVS